MKKKYKRTLVAIGILSVILMVVCIIADMNKTTLNISDMFQNIV